MKRLWIFMVVLAVAYCATVDRAYSRIRRHNPLFTPRPKWGQRMEIEKEEKEALFTPMPKQERRVETEKEEKIYTDSPDSMYIWRMTKFLDLTQEQNLKLFPLINQVRKNKQGRIKRKKELVNELKELRNYELDEVKIEIILDKIKELGESMRAHERALYKYIEENLSVKQRALYTIFQEEYRKKRK